MHTICLELRGMKLGQAFSNIHQINFKMFSLRKADNLVTESWFLFPLLSFLIFFSSLVSQFSTYTLLLKLSFASVCGLYPSHGLLCKKRWLRGFLFLFFKFAVKQWVSSWMNMRSPREPEADYWCPLLTGDSDGRSVAAQPQKLCRQLRCITRLGTLF